MKRGTETEASEMFDAALLSLRNELRKVRGCLHNGKRMRLMSQYSKVDPVFLSEAAVVAGSRRRAGSGKGQRRRRRARAAQGEPRHPAPRRGQAG